MFTRRSVLSVGAGIAMGSLMEKAMAKADEQTTKRQDFDAVVIGGSFAGQSAAMQLARARRRVLMIDAGKPRNRFAKTSHGFFGFDGKSPKEIVETAHRQLLAYPTARILNGEVISAEPSENGFQLELADGAVHSAARIVIATGMKDELPDIAGLAERWGVTALHCPYCHGYEVAGRQLGVLGAGPLSVHQAALVADWGPVTLFLQGQTELDADQSALLNARGVKIEPSPVVELLGPAPELEAVRLSDGRTEPLGAMFLAARASFVSDLATRMGCAQEEGPLGPYLKVDDQKMTSVPNVLAAGDVAAPMPNATLASAAGLTAGVSAHQSLIFG